MGALGCRDKEGWHVYPFMFVSSSSRRLHSRIPLSAGCPRCTEAPTSNRHGLILIPSWSHLATSQLGDRSRAVFHRRGAPQLKCNTVIGYILNCFEDLTRKHLLKPFKRCAKEYIQTAWEASQNMSRDPCRAH
jgi:hypothetical protein